MKKVKNDGTEDTPVAKDLAKKDSGFLTVSQERLALALLLSIVIGVIIALAVIPKANADDTLEVPEVIAIESTTGPVVTRICEWIIEADSKYDSAAFRTSAKAIGCDVIFTNKEVQAD